MQIEPSPYSLPDHTVAICLSPRYFATTLAPVPSISPSPERVTAYRIFTIHLPFQHVLSYRPFHLLSNGLCHSHP